MRYRYRDPRQKCKGNRWFFNENLVRGNNAGRYSLFFFFSPLSWLISSFFFCAVPSKPSTIPVCLFSRSLGSSLSLSHSLSSRRHGTVTAFKNQGSALSDPRRRNGTMEPPQISCFSSVVLGGLSLRPSALRLSSVFFFCR